jgi:alpha-galactosidase
MKAHTIHRKVVVIGAGSASFGLVNLGAILRHPKLNGIELWLVDVNADGLASIAALAERMNREWGSNMTIHATTNRHEALQGAGYIILSVAVDREACWASDVAIAAKYGITHYGENGGPGALFHTARNVNLILPILRDIEKWCPKAWVFNFTNPVPRMVIAAARYTSVNMVGLCHQIDFGYLMSAKLLQKDFGFEVPKDYRFTWESGWDDFGAMVHQAKHRLDILAAGLNHFSFFLSIEDKEKGSEVLPLFKERFLNDYPEFEPYTREILRHFDMIPVGGDCHMLEYLPYTHNTAKGSWAHYDIQMYPLTQAVGDRHAMWDRIEAMALGKEPIDPLKESHSERAEELIVAIMHNEPLYDPAINLPNRGFIDNLPEGAIVEVPALISAKGIHGLPVGPLPDIPAYFCRIQIDVAEMAVKAAVTGDRQLLLQALLMDPMVDDLRAGEAMFEEYLEANKAYLPQFFPTRSHL